VPIPKTLEMMAKTVGTALDPDCFEALKRAMARLQAEDQLCLDQRLAA
jgi:HD-GYP domain-containing protein (c-di-GMP phosphodiesterase class II)